MYTDISIYKICFGWIMKNACHINGFLRRWAYNKKRHEREGNLLLLYIMKRVYYMRSFIHNAYDDISHILFFCHHGTKRWANCVITIEFAVSSNLFAFIWRFYYFAGWVCWRISTIWLLIWYQGCRVAWRKKNDFHSFSSKWRLGIMKRWIGNK